MYEKNIDIMYKLAIVKLCFRNEYESYSERESKKKNAA